MRRGRDRKLQRGNKDFTGALTKSQLCHIPAKSLHPETWSEAAFTSHGQIKVCVGRAWTVQYKLEHGC